MKASPPRRAAAQAGPFGRNDAMKTIGLQIAIGLALMSACATANAETIRTPINKGTDAVAQDASSRHRLHHGRVVRIHRYPLYSSYPRAPWYSRDYFPRYYTYAPLPILVVYRQ